MPSSTHTEIQQALGAFALDAVDGDEREAIEIHLLECPRCRAEVTRHREVASMLGHVGAPAPSGVWDRITATMDEAPPALHLVRGSSAVSVPRRWLTTALVAAAVSALLATTAGVRVVQQERRLDELAAAMRSDPLRQSALATLADPSARRTVLRSADGAWTATLAAAPDGKAYLVADNLRPLPAARTYQLWALVGDEKISTAVLGADPGLIPFQAPNAVDGFAITEEDAPGATAPTRVPVVVGFLRA